MSINNFNIANENNEKISNEEFFLKDILDTPAILNLAYTCMLTNLSKSKKNILNQQGINPEFRNNHQEIDYLKKLIKFQK